ncbi:MAG: MFS transporter [Rhodospirillales bacterium]
MIAIRTSNTGRWVLIGAALMMALSMGIRQSLSLFLTPVTRDLALTAAQFTLSIAVQNAVWGISQAPVSMLADKYGMRPMMVSGALIYLLGVVTMGFSTGSASLVLSGCFIGVAMACTASSLAMTAAARAVPEHKRSVTLGIVSAVGSMGTPTVAMSVQTLLKNYDWHTGIVLFAMLALALLPMAYFAGGADKLPKPTGNKATMSEVLGQAIRHRGFLVMSACYFVCGLNLIFLTTHLPNYLNICGLDPMLSAQALAIIGGVNIAGSYVAGWLGGRYPKHLLLGILYLLRSCVITAFFITPPSPTSTLVFSAVMGMLWLGVIPLTGGLVAEMFGTRYMATLLGMSFVVHQTGSFLGAWGGGLIFDALGSYDRAWQTGVLIGAIAGVVQIAFGGPPRKTEAMPAAVPA